MVEDRQRHWERQDYEIKLTLVLNNGDRISGRTLDVSLGGLFFKPDQDDHKILVGDKGKLRVQPESENAIFPCQVVRVNEDGIGVSFQDKQAAFGMFVTHDMMLDLLTSINNAFANSLDLETTLRTGVDHIKDYLQCEAASLFLLEDNDSALVCRACAGPVDITGLRLNPHEGIVGSVIESGDDVIIHDVSKDPHFAAKVDAATGFKTESILCAPLRIHGRVFGALEVLNKRGAGLFQGHDRVVLTALASATAMAINNSNLAEAALERDAADRSNQAKSKFISSMSHELRTPLNAILGFAQILNFDAEENLDLDGQEAIGHILSSGEHLLTLINEILDLAKIESGEFSVGLVATSSDEILEDCMSLGNALAEAHGITIEHHRNGAPLPHVMADPTRLKQVLLNLVSNAIKYNNPDGRVTLSTRHTDSGMFRFMVKDTGPGIPDSLQDKVFTPFERLGQEVEGIEGSGIGLAISAKLVEAMNGRIDFESTSGKGSSFWIDLPLA